MNKKDVRFQRSCVVGRFCFILAAVVVSGFAAAAARGEPVHHYEFEVNADDSVGGNHGTLMGDAQIVNDAQRGNVLGLDGDGDYVEFSDYFVTTTEFTIAAWANHYGPGGGVDAENPILQQRDDDSVVGYAESSIILYTERSIGSPDPYAGVIVRTSGVGQLLHDPMRDYGQWHHYAVTVDSTNIVYYIDGLEVDTAANEQTGNYVTDVDHISIGKHSYRGADRAFFYGTIDDVRIYDNALAPEAVAAIVPEPTTIGFFALAGLMLVRKRCT